MKIVCLCTRLDTSGATLNAVLLAKGFRTLGHEAEVWCLMQTGSLDHEDVPVRVMAPNTPRTFWTWFKLLKNFGWHVFSWRPDTIIGFHPLANVLGGVSRFMGLPRMIGTQRNPAESQSPLMAKLERWVGSTPLYHANVAVTDAVRASFQDYPVVYRAKMQVIHNGLPVLRPSALTPAAARASFGLPNEVYLLGNLGRFHHQKNLAFLLDCLVQLPSMHLALAGHGPEEAMLRARVAQLNLTERVHFVGMVQGVRITEFYRALDAFVMPSRFEGFGRTLLEACALDVPVVCSDLPVFHEVGAGALLTTPLAVSTWVQTLQTLATTPELQATCRARGQQRVAELTPELMVARYAELLI
jgi:glycosyltransferase involved in cell wall biosynthesis